MNQMKFSEKATIDAEHAPTHTQREAVLGIISLIKESLAPHSRCQRTIAFGKPLQHHRNKYASAIRIYTNSTLKDDNVHELPLCKSQPPFVWGTISSVCAVEQPPTCFLPYLLQIIPQQFCIQTAECLIEDHTHGSKK